MTAKHLVWSDQRPTVAGTYYYRATPQSDPVLDVVFRSHFSGALYCGSYGTWQTSHIPVAKRQGEWAGPIPLPKEK